MIKTNNPVALVIEDDPPVRNLLDEVLQEAGYEVVAVPNGSAALSILESLKVDIITLDLDLPDLPGSELLNMLRQRRLKVPPVIVITSYMPVKRYLQRMAQAVMPKPFDVDDLLTVVLQLLPRRSLTKARVYEQQTGNGQIA